VCRLMAYVSATGATIEDLLGPREFAGFRDLSRLHRDGWGMAWLTGADEPPLPDVGRITLRDGRLRATRSILPAYEDSAFGALAGWRLGEAGLLHLRWATSGLAVTESNTHPFLTRGWAFAHQGSIPSSDLLDSLLAPVWSARREGTTDSERYFLYLLQCIETEGGLVAGAQHAVTEIIERCGPASLNAVLLSPSSLLVVHGLAGLEPPREDILSAVATPEDVPLDHLEGYFRLRYRRRDGDLVVTSSGLAAEGWQALPDESILHVELGTRATSLHAFEGSPMPMPDAGLAGRRT